jgi:hypothetical protein
MKKSSFAGLSEFAAFGEVLAVLMWIYDTPWMQHTGIDKKKWIKRSFGERKKPAVSSCRHRVVVLFGPVHPLAKRLCWAARARDVHRSCLGSSRLRMVWRNEWPENVTVA